MMAQVLKLPAVHRQLARVKQMHTEVDEGNEQQHVQRRHDM